MGWRVALIASLLGGVLAGCGSSSSPSGLEPTPLAPASSIVYLDLTVRPQGSLQASAESALTRLIGHSPDAQLQTAVGKLFRRSGLSWAKDIRPWLGQHVGVVVTSFSRRGLALIAPSNDPSAGLSTLKRTAKTKLSAASYSGVHYQQGISGGSPLDLGVIGRHDVVIGGPDAFRAIVDAYHGKSIASAPGFSSVFSTLPANSLLKGYVNVAGIGARLHSALGALPGSTALTPSLERQLLGSLSHRLHGQHGFALAVSPRAFSAEVRSSQPRPPSGSADVSRLPEASWLAVATGAFNTGSAKTALGASLAQNPLFAQALALFRQRFGFDYVHDLIPTLGPFDLAIQGSTLIGLGAGLAMKPSDPAAAARLLAAIYRLASTSSSLSVQGTPRGFEITKAGLPIPRVSVGLLSGRVLITVDESSAQFLSPGRTLASNPDFQRARSAGPAGGRVPVFLDFRSLASLLANIPSTSSGSGHKLLAVLRRLDYLAVAESATGSESRVTLALH